MENLQIQTLIRLITVRAERNARDAYKCSLKEDKNGENEHLSALRAQNEILDLMGAREINHLFYYNENA